MAKHAFLAKTAATALALSVAAGAALAQSATISDKQLKQFAMVQQELIQIQQQMQQQLSGAQDPEQKQELQQQVQAQMNQAVKDSPLTIKQFNIIGNELRGSEEARNRYRELLQN